MTETATNPGDNAATESAATIERLQGELKAARDESAKHRTARNDALRHSEARRQVIAAHNIEFDTASANLKQLEIADGKATGDIGYKPPALVQPTTTAAATPQNSDGAVLTMDALQSMPPDEVNRRWDEVQRLLKQQRR